MAPPAPPSFQLILAFPMLLQAPPKATSNLHGRQKRGGGGGGGDASPAMEYLGRDVPPDLRIKWPKSSVFSDFRVFFG